MVNSLQATKRGLQRANVERDEALTRLYAERQRTRAAIAKLHALRNRYRASERASSGLNLTDAERIESAITSPQEQLVVRLAALNGKMPQSRPRYFSLVQIAARDVAAFAGTHSTFSRQWLLPDGSLALLLARTGQILEEYRTIIACLSPTTHPRAKKKGSQHEPQHEPTEEYAFTQMMERGRARRLSAMKVVDSHVVSHNLAALLMHARAERRTAGLLSRAPTLLAIGGQYMEHRANRLSHISMAKGWSATHHAGVHAMNASSLTDIVERSWFPYHKADNITRPVLFDGRHPGCVEKRRGFGAVCYFDGRFSLVHFRERFLVYARANLKALGGGRYVQVAVSARSPSYSLADGFGPFSLITIQGYDMHGPGNVYLASVKRHPFGDPSLVIGLFAVNMGNQTEGHVERWREGGASFHGYGNTDGRSFIGLAISCNGQDFSHLIEVAPSTGLQGRTLDMPVDGFMSHQDGRVSLLIHRDVYEISPIARQHSRLVRRELNAAALSAFADEVTPTLLGCEARSRA